MMEQDIVDHLNVSVAYGDMLGCLESQSPEKSHNFSRRTLSPSNKKRRADVGLENEFNPQIRSPIIGRISLEERLLRQFQKNRDRMSGFGLSSQWLPDSATQSFNTSFTDGPSCSEDTSGPFYGLPLEFKEMFRDSRGISELYEWQDACLKHNAIANHSNFIISLPTSGGKTLVAEILILKEIFKHHKDAILILPFVSIVEEKVRALAPFALKFNFLIEEYAGTKGRIPPIKHRIKNVVYIATIERASTLINSLFELKAVERLGLAVVDELHMIGERGDRGPLLEQTLTKLLCYAKQCQIVGMSATLNNIEDLCSFLRAKAFSRDFRPVELTEFIKLGVSLFKIRPDKENAAGPLEFSRSFNTSTTDKDKDPDNLAELVLETVPQNSLLVFCSSKKNAENVALLLSKQFPESLRNHKKAEKLALYESLKRDCGGKVCSTLKVTLAFGIAYHHSGLTLDERALIEEAFRDGTLCVITCTSTLAAGVNLPAKRVIIRSPSVGIEFIDFQKYKQMAGRAGRAGLDTSGESITILQPSQRKQFLSMIVSRLQPCESGLGHTGGLKAFILSLFGLELVRTEAELIDSAKCTLFAVQLRKLNGSDVELEQIVSEHLNDFFKSGLLKKLDTEDGRIEISQFGTAVYKGNISPQVGCVLYQDLKLCLNTIVLSTHLHLLYCVIPYDLVQEISPDYKAFYEEYCALSAEERKVCEVLGVLEQHLFQLSMGAKVIGCPGTDTLKRLYLALVVNELWKQGPIWTVANKFSLPRGYVQNLMKSTAASAGSILRFCEPLDELWALKELLPNFARRLSHCVNAELIPLMELQCVKAGRAKQLFNAGFKTLGIIAHANHKDLCTKIENLPVRQAKQIINSAKLLIQERLAALVEEANDVLN